MAKLRFQWFGSPQITLDGQPVRTDRRKAVALLAYLTLEPGAHRREQLAALFWPDFDASSAHAYLRRTLWEIHQMIGREWITSDRADVALNLSTDLWVDVNEYEQLIEKGLAARVSGQDGGDQALEQAASIYRGDFMAGFSLRDSLEFDAWQQQRSESLRLQLYDVLERLARAAIVAGDAQKAITYASHWVELDPLNEPARRALIESYARAGQRSAALRQYDTCVEMLHNELGVEPELETRQLASMVRTGGLPALARVVKAGVEEPFLVHPVPLPVYPSAFVGRESELLEIADLLSKPECRLVTLLGTGGSGKTRLAVEVGRRYADRYEHGVGFVSLAAIREVESILPAIGRALNLTYRLPGGEEVPSTDSQAQLFNYLREKSILLITDNWEHLLEGCPVLSELLEVAPGLKILTTSREKLNLPEEWIFDVRGLSYPAEVSEDGLERYSAYQLFVQSAHRSLSSFSPDGNQRRCIAALCRLLDGLPLGIELAASWVRKMDCTEILTEIQHNIAFLESSLRGIPERHRSLRAVFDHSWELLSEPEREIMERLSVFRGGFSRQAAEWVAKASLDQLGALMDKSLLTRDPGGRYGMHEVLKQLSAQRLEENPELQRETRAAHSVFFLDWLVAAWEFSAGSRQRESLQQFDLEIENIGVACQWAVEQNWWPRLIQALPVLFLFHDTSSSYRYSEEILRSALETARPFYQANPRDKQALIVLVLLLSLYCHTLLELNQIDDYRNVGLESYALLKDLEPSVYKAWGLTFIAFGYLILDRQEVIRNTQIAYELFEKSNERRGMAIALGELAGLLDQKEHETATEEAKGKLKQAIEWIDELNDQWMRARFLNSLARVHNFHGEYLQAREYLLEALDIFEELGENWPVVDIRFNLGQNATWLGFYDEAEKYFKASLSFLQNMGSGPYHGAHLDSLGYIEFLRKNYDKAEAYCKESLIIYQRSRYPAGESMVYNNLGDLAGVRSDTAAAIGYYQKGIALLPADSEYWEHSILIKNLGRALLETGDLEGAERNLREAQRYATLVERVPDVLEIDMTAAKILARRGNLLRALEILSMVQDHPASTQIVREQAREVLAELSAELPQDSVKKALEVGKILQPGCAFNMKDDAHG